jgi:hypothetical protein
MRLDWSEAVNTILATARDCLYIRCMLNQLHKGKKVLLQKLIYPLNLSRDSLLFIELKVLVLCSLQFNPTSCPQPDVSNPFPLTLFS